MLDMVENIGFVKVHMTHDHDTPNHWGMCLKSGTIQLRVKFSLLLPNMA